MSTAFDIEPDLALRRRLSHPENAHRSVGRSPGASALRFRVALLDWLQMVVVSTSTASLFWPDQTLQAAGLGIIGACLALMIRRGTRPSTLHQRRTIATEARHAGFAVVTACLTIVMTVVFVGRPENGIGFGLWLSSWAAISATLSYAGRNLPLPLVRGTMLRSIQPTVAIVGGEHDAQMMVDLLARRGTHLVTARFKSGSTYELRSLEQLASRGKIDKVVVVGGDEALLSQICFALADTPTLVFTGFVSEATSILNGGGPNSIRYLPLIPLLPSPMSEWQEPLKRVIDVAVTALALPFMAPLLLLVAAAIRIESPGPVLFHQWRFGLGSTPRKIIKFRTMYHEKGDVSGEARTLACDPRVTKVGRLLRRTSIDELPQLLNVLRGEMSLVGPRPHATHMKIDGDYYFEAVKSYRFRHRVKPGITGWAQVTGSRGEVDTIEKALERIEKDLWYVQNWSLMLDFRILMLTLMGGFFSKDAD